MKLGIIVYSADPETVWNALRLGNFARKQNDDVKVFLLAKGVECEGLDTPRFKVTEQLQDLAAAGGEILACGTCLKIRQQDESALCPISTMKDLYELIRDSDKVVSF